MTDHFVPTYPSIDYASFTPNELDQLHELKDGTIRLFTNIACPYGQRALWTGLETKAPFQVIEVSLKEQPDSYHEKFNRYATVPYLLDDGFAVHESAIVAAYIDAKFNNGQLHRLHDPQAASIAQLVFAKYEASPFYKYLSTGDEAAKVQVQEVLKELERIYVDNAKTYRSAGPYLLGEDLSSAEINLFPFFYRFEIVFRHYRKFDFLADYPTLRGAFEAAKGRPAFQQTLLSQEYYIQQYAGRIRDSAP